MYSRCGKPSANARSPALVVANPGLMKRAPYAAAPCWSASVVRTGPLPETGIRPVVRVLARGADDSIASVASGAASALGATAPLLCGAPEAPAVDAADPREVDAAEAGAPDAATALGADGS